MSSLGFPRPGHLMALSEWLAIDLNTLLTIDRLGTKGSVVDADGASEPSDRKSQPEEDLLAQKTPR